MEAGLPLHVLGESHYGTADEHEPRDTYRIVRACAFGPSKCGKLFTTVVNVVATALDEQRPFDFRRRMWERRAFSNSIQDLLQYSRKGALRRGMAARHRSLHGPALLDRAADPVGARMALMG